MTAGAMTGRVLKQVLGQALSPQRQISAFAGWRALGFAAALGIGMSVTSAKADENWESAKAAFEICLEHFPNMKRIHDALAAEGWRYEGNEQGLKIHSKNGYRAIAATQGNRQIATRCVVSSSRLSEATAIDYAAKVAARMEASAPIDLSARRVPAAWEGQMRGVTVRLGVVPTTSFGVMRGAVVVLGEF